MTESCEVVGSLGVDTGHSLDFSRFRNSSSASRVIGDHHSSSREDDVRRSMNQDFSRHSSVLTFPVQGAFVAALKYLRWIVIPACRERGMSVNRASSRTGPFSRPLRPFAPPHSERNDLNLAPKSVPRSRSHNLDDGAGFGTIRPEVGALAPTGSPSGKPWAFAREQRQRFLGHG